MQERLGISSNAMTRKLRMHNLGAIAEFERERIRERVPGS
jgi:DNA invertase Pin-like site-specific DNA recombinase